MAEPQENGNPQTAPMPIILVITLHPNGAINVEGPIDNKLLCFGMLTSAEHAIANHDPSKAASKIVPVHGHLGDRPFAV